MRRVLALVNRKSGLRWSFETLRGALDGDWESADIDLSYQFCHSVEDGIAKTRRAVANGVDTILVVGGDGTVNTVGRTLIGTDVSLGIIPVGSGNGFARHFEIPLSPAKAARALADAVPRRIDVGVVNELPFLVTCSMAWEAAITESFAKSPFRGILPYVFAGMHELIEYTPQDVSIVLDGGEAQGFKKPMIFTIANLSQYGGGARIAPEARADDGFLELVVALRQDTPKLIANLGRLFDGTLSRLPEVVTRRFKSLEIVRPEASPIQVDGELIESPRRLSVTVKPACLKVLVPRESRRQKGHA